MAAVSFCWIIEARDLPSWRWASWISDIRQRPGCGGGNRRSRRGSSVWRGGNRKVSQPWVGFDVKIFRLEMDANHGCPPLHGCPQSLTRG